MSSDPIQEIRALAVSFRRACELADKGPLKPLLDAFPRGACGDASLLLAHHFELHGHYGFDYMLGRVNGGSHAWLQRDDLVVDITADQFGSHLPPVIVSTSSPWHTHLNAKKEHAATLEGYDPHWRGVLLRMYRHVVNWLPE